MNNLEANVIISRCWKTKKKFGIRVEKRNGDWYLTWAFKITESQIESEGYAQNKISGNFYFNSKYPGCPYCGNNGYAKCSCGKMYCLQDQEPSICPWCGKSCNEYYTTNDFTFESNGF